MEAKKNNNNNIKRMYNTLRQQIEEEEYEDALNICEKILKLDPEDAKALKCKLVCMIYENQIEEACKLANKAREKISCEFELAYTYYRLNQLDKAFKVMESVGEKNSAMKQLYAQVLYRMENFSAAADAYEQVINDNTDYENYDVEKVELCTNLSASYGQANEPKKAIQVAENFDEEANYEIEFNRACALIAANDMANSIRALEKSEILARKHLEEEEDEEPDEIEKEVAIIKVQLGVVEQLKGNIESAKKLYNDALKTGTKKQSAVAVASSNLIALRKDHDMFDSYKKMKNVKVNKLSKSQMKMVHFNQALLLLHMGKDAELKKLVDSDKNDGNLNIVMAALLFKKDQNYKKCTQFLEKYYNNVKATADGIVQAKLSAAHVHILNGNLKEAVNILKNIPSLQNTPGTTATLIALYDRLGNNEKAKETMDQALENSKSSSHRVALMSSGALDDLNKRRYEAASKGFQDILKNASKLNLDEETQSIARAHYITSCVYVDSNIAMNESNNIPDFVSNESSKLSEEDLIRLEGNATGVKHENKKVRSSSLDNVEEIKLDDKPTLTRKRNEKKIKKRRAKRREAYLAKMNAMDRYDEHNPIPTPDPERWIPRAMRKSTRRRVRRGEAHTSGGAQGSGYISEKDLRKLDAKARAEDEAKKIAAMKVIEEEKNINRRGKRGKKKKKGRRR